MSARPAGIVLPLLLFAALALVPLLAKLGPESFILAIMTRVAILALAAMSLDLLIGYGGLVSFGHAAYLGIGAYAVGILSSHGIEEAGLQLAVGLAVAATFALATGAIALRTEGVYFIMITLAFGQMLFFLATSLAAYGGDDGMTLSGRSRVFGTAFLRTDLGLYVASFAALVLAYLLCRRITVSRFGRVVAGTRENRVRMEAIGFSPYRFQLVAYVIAGTIAGLAGFLAANQTEFVSPASMSWQRSGDLIFMVVLGGTGTLHGAIAGAAAFILIEEVLSHVTEHWRIVFGPLLILAVLFARGGIAGLFRPRGA
ncbi:branched-chain amino acid ABC transporter permease [uncultured Enterovirga sp.]|uniref:branched-chain amino acid ABC transporter permease n=1 Tax=uncultured Enterovirga sp. TaxID=2026352 RepID=UPI0035CC0AC3